MIHPWVARAIRTRPFLALAPGLHLPQLDAAAHRLTGGRLLPSRLLLPTVLLTTTGHRTGRSHTTPLCAHKYADGSWLIAATNFGRPRHPAWSTNLLHHPRGTVTHRDHQCAVEAALLPASQHGAIRPELLRILPVYDHYASRAARDIRIFRLIPTIASP
ncbi:nitroreductase family deazaflavin-dependent oxidoreductase [Streptomyces sp. NBC_01314]|uniref:nitroreductase family deazaflavin-dependent oxidoreductase n=1 Tax=Streptomyces sp. NBC_01314 TaxID=2903821 RepID=UPI00309198BA|nr:nitroreductase family deazaflavin-dependent oxidoreductase [Streptomyces sp. NBC_01314]